MAMRHFSPLHHKPFLCDFPRRRPGLDASFPPRSTPASSHPLRLVAASSIRWPICGGGGGSGGLRDDGSDAGSWRRLQCSAGGGGGANPRDGVDGGWRQLGYGLHGVSIGVVQDGGFDARRSDKKGGGLLVYGVDAFGIWRCRQMQATPLLSDASTANIKWWEAWVLGRG